MKKKPQQEFPLSLDFFDMFVHELKAPLMSFQIQLENLKKAEKSRKQLVLIQKMENDLQKLFQFIHDGLEIQHLKGAAILNNKWTSWQNILSLNIEKFQEQISQKNLKILMEGPLLEVYMDPFWIHSVISNLLINAIQHSPEKGHIWLKSQINNKGDLLFSIIDEGHGIKEELKNQVFDRFKSCRKKPGSVQTGTGLGLYIAQAVVVQLYGRKIHIKEGINADSCTFSFTLPQARLQKSYKKVS